MPTKTAEVLAANRERVLDEATVRVLSTNAYVWSNHPHDVEMATELAQAALAPYLDQLALLRAGYQMCVPAFYVSALRSRRGLDTPVADVQSAASADTVDHETTEEE